MKTVRWLYLLLGFSLVIGLPVSGHAQSVAISQVYGGGGNQGASLRNDFVELLNRGGTSVDVTGWTVQYASATGSSWDRTVLQGVIEPGQYYLVQQAQGAGGSVDLPAAQAVGQIRLSATSGKVALVNNSVLLSGTSPAGPQVVDFVGYGSANFYEGTAAPSLTNTTAALRGSGGCTDSGNNGKDFAVGTPNPRNSASPKNLCVPVSGPTPSVFEGGLVSGASFALHPSPVAPGSIVAIFGTELTMNGAESPFSYFDNEGKLATNLAGATVRINGIKAPLFSAYPGQINAQIPMEVAGSVSATVEVDVDGRAGTPRVFFVDSVAPGIFTVPSGGQGPGAITHADGSLVTAQNPARPEEVVVIYCTGLGEVVPPLLTGMPAGSHTTVARPSVTIDSLPADVEFSGMTPGLVALNQVNVRIPATSRSGNSLPLVLTVNGKQSNSVTIAVSTGQAPEPGSSDFAPIPADTLALVSWNIQVGGTSTDVDAPRPPMVQAALADLFAGTYQILAAQEISSGASAEVLRSLLPGGATLWNASFFDTTDTQDNGFWFRDGVALQDALPLFITDQTDAAGRIVTDPSRAVHPPQVAHIAVGDFDFTLITVHLTFADGSTAESVRELQVLLDWLDGYFNDPLSDPDVLICGDFNIPSRDSGQTGTGGTTLDAVLERDPRFQQGNRSFTVTVDEPTSRASAANLGSPRNNYDHCLLSADALEEFLFARRVSTEILTVHPEDPEVRLTSDHFPIVAMFRTSGDAVRRDVSDTLISQGPPSEGH